MITRGAPIPDEEVQTVVDYLAANFNIASVPPADTLRTNSGPKLINVNAATARQLSFAFGLTPEEAGEINTIVALGASTRCGQNGEENALAPILERIGYKLERAKTNTGLGRITNDPSNELRAEAVAK